MQEDENGNPPDERNQSPEGSETAQPNKGRRRRRMSTRRKWMLLGLAGVFLVIAVVYGAYWLLVLRYYTSTEDAYVHGNKIMLTPQISGTVTSVDADNTDLVRAGQSVIKLDKSNERVALNHAEANLAQTVRHVRQLYDREAEQAAAVKIREAQRAQARRDYERDRHLVKVNGVSQQHYQHTKTALKTARSQLAAARQKLKGLKAQTDGTTLRNHPQVKLAESELMKAYLNYRRTVIPAPVTGYVAQRQVQVGEKVDPSKPMLAIVPLNQVWVQANFKETDVQQMRIGQPVTLHADFYGSSVTYHGHLAGISPGTGSAFELLPPQNATGNWIKIVRRVPVRITLKPKEVKKHPLRLGLSMTAKVDLHNTSGPVLAKSPPPKPVYSTNVYTMRKSHAQALIRQILQANDGKGGSKAAGASGSDGG